MIDQIDVQFSTVLYLFGFQQIHFSWVWCDGESDTYATLKTFDIRSVMKWNGGVLTRCQHHEHRNVQQSNPIRLTLGIYRTFFVNLKIILLNSAVRVCLQLNQPKAFWCTRERRQWFHEISVILMWRTTIEISLEIILKLSLKRICWCQSFCLSWKWNAKIHSMTFNFGMNALLPRLETVTRHMENDKKIICVDFAHSAIRQIPVQKTQKIECGRNTKYTLQLLHATQWLC